MNHIQKVSQQILEETEKIIVGKNDRIKLLLLGILADGHILIDDVPGVGKTTLAKTMALVLGCRFQRVQFVSDLMPGDILGMNIFNQKTGEFEVKQGPIHTNILLADEINRATARTQSALLEAMEERQTTIDTQRFLLPKPFIVIATENPVEQENTFQLPIAQLDRFMLRIRLGYPDKAEELKMLTGAGDRIDFDRIEAVTGPEELAELQREIDRIHVSPGVLSYIVDLIDATRNLPELTLGASPRAAKALYRASKTWAAMAGREFVTPDDVQAVALPVLNHRLILGMPAKIAGESSYDIIEALIQKVKIKKDEKTLLY